MVKDGNETRKGNEKNITQRWGVQKKKKIKRNNVVQPQIIGTLHRSKSVRRLRGRKKGEKKVREKRWGTSFLTWEEGVRQQKKEKKRTDKRRCAGGP